MRILKLGLFSYLFFVLSFSSYAYRESALAHFGSWKVTVTLQEDYDKYADTEFKEIKTAVMALTTRAQYAEAGGEHDLKAKIQDEHYRPIRMILTDDHVSPDRREAIAEQFKLLKAHVETYIGDFAKDEASIKKRTARANVITIIKWFGEIVPNKLNDYFQGNLGSAELARMDDDLGRGIMTAYAFNRNLNTLYLKHLMTYFDPAPADEKDFPELYAFLRASAVSGNVSKLSSLFREVTPMLEQIKEDIKDEKQAPTPPPRRGSSAR